MKHDEGHERAGGETSRRLYVYSGGFLAQKRLRRILGLAGYRLSLGVPAPDDLVGVWGQSPYAHRGERIAAQRGARVVRIEDAFLRSLHPGRSGDPPLGLMIDHTGVHFDGRHPSDLEHLLATDPLDDSAILDRARGVIARMREGHLSKYSATLPDADAPPPGYVLVVDQTRGDASVRASDGDRSRFLEMLFVAREENPGANILIKTHPETTAGLREGHFTEADAVGPVRLYDGSASPWTLLEGATRVYTLSSQMGFEAILAGHKPRVFGRPFYAGWGLTEDEETFPRRTRVLTRAQLVAGALVLFPTWYDPYSDCLCDVETVLGALDAQARAWREDRNGWVMIGARLWKRRTLQDFLGQYRRLRFEDDVEKAREVAARDGRRLLSWASKGIADGVRMEDGFLRSRGLGAELVPPLSLALDEVGIHFDPGAPSTLEQWIQRRAAGLRPDQFERIHRLKRSLLDAGLTKYNLTGPLPELPEGRRILVPGQVEDDASILRGSPDLRSNAELLRLAREANPDAVLIWKPHPDVEAGLRKGVVTDPERWADTTLRDVDMAAVLNAVDEVWTLTSGTGFEALMRGCRVTTLGVPFYAGWGLTTDLEPVPERRLAGPRPTIEALMHAALVDYPRYFDPVTKAPCPVETVVLRLSNGRNIRQSLANRSLSKAQGALASYAHLWRR
ncbi:capsular polysaccharide export protein [Sagittula marina]|uniref:Capsular polysaccharide export protein n=1 Tax=Sagittula marina TaxID=943940 RepID=A0A7W6DSU7_9RHOB|nr:capsular polysaccharide biosynthesis protein [Sagittula marina]MBB3986085.1 capsular polysaccharide export protein [Sagittula marina]